MRAKTKADLEASNFIQQKGQCHKDEIDQTQEGSKGRSYPGRALAAVDVLEYEGWHTTKGIAGLYAHALQETTLSMHDKRRKTRHQDCWAYLITDAATEQKLWGRAV